MLTRDDQQKEVPETARDIRSRYKTATKMQRVGQPSRLIDIAL